MTQNNEHEAVNSIEFNDIALKQQSEAWQAVCCALNEVKPNWMGSNLTAMECAVNAIKELAQSPISQNEQQEAVSTLEDWLTINMPSGTVIGDPSWWARKIRNVLALTSPLKQIPDGGNLIGKVSEMGVVWHKQNPHAHPVGTEFYAVLPTASLTSETNTEVRE